MRGLSESPSRTTSNTSFAGTREISGRGAEGVWNNASASIWILSVANSVGGKPSPIAMRVVTEVPSEETSASSDSVKGSSSSVFRRPFQKVAPAQYGKASAT